MIVSLKDKGRFFLKDVVFELVYEERWDLVLWELGKEMGR